MNEPITLAKVRKETTVKIPAGGWMILVHPDKPFAEHANTRNGMLGNTNDDYEKVVIGRLRNTAPDLRFLTVEQKAKADKEAERFRKSLAGSANEAKEIQKNQNATQLEKERAAHAIKLEEQNKVNDAIRNQNKSKAEIEKEKAKAKADKEIADKEKADKEKAEKDKAEKETKETETETKE